MSFENLSRIAAVSTAGAVIALGGAAPAEAAPQLPAPYYMTHDAPQSGFELQASPHNTFVYTPITYQETPTSAVALPWAETFIAQDVTPSNVSGVMALLTSVEKSPLTKVLRIDVEGVSSDEALVNEPNAGLGIADPRNVTLAIGRAENAATTISDELTKDGKTLPVDVTGGKEDVLSETEVHRLETMAEADGETLNKAVTRYDYGYGAANINAALTKDLGNQRGVEVTVVAQVAIPIGATRDEQEKAPQEDTRVSGQEPETPQNTEQIVHQAGFFNKLHGKFGSVVAGLGILAAGLRRNASSNTPAPAEPEQVPAEQSDADVSEDDRELVGSRH